ncbi:MAG: hypothetical protein QM736_28410 [Vicinamibacterales bacterium]
MMPLVVAGTAALISTTLAAAMAMSANIVMRLRTRNIRKMPNHVSRFIFTTLQVRQHRSRTEPMRGR